MTDRDDAADMLIPAFSAQTEVWAAVGAALRYVKKKAKTDAAAARLIQRIEASLTWADAEIIGLRSEIHYNPSTE